MEFYNILNIIKNTLLPAENVDNTDDEWLNKLITKVKNYKNEDKEINFKIVELKSNGFLVKIEGLFAYVNFNRMPWVYEITNFWALIFPYIKYKVFRGKIDSILEPNDNLSHHRIFVYGVLNKSFVPNFKQNKRYSCIMLKRVDKGVLVDFGYYFMWRSGSIIEFIPSDNFDSELFVFYEPGDAIELIYYGLDSNGNRIFGNNNELTNKVDGVIAKELGDNVEVKVKVINKFKTYIVNDKYMGILKESTNDVNRNKHTHEAIGLFKNGDIIQCDVVSVNSKDQIIIIEWKNDEQIEKIYSRKFDKGIQVKNKLTNIEKPVVENILDKNSDNTENKNNSETNAQVVPFKIKYIGAKSGKKNRNRKVKKVHFEQNFEEKYLSNYKNPYISEIESKLYGISNFVKSETFDKLRLIGQTVPVEIQCKYDASGKANNKYFVDGKYKANLLITNYNHIISNIDKSIIEKNFQNGDEIHGEVLSIENDTFLVKWIISDTDLNRFLAENIPISTK